MDDLDLDDRQRRVVARLAAHSDTPTPPTGLADATLATVAARTTVWATRRPALDRDPVYAGWLRTDVVVAAGLGFVTVLLATSAVAKVRAESQTLACQERLRELHTAIAHYGDTHAGRLPAPGFNFADELRRTGQLPDDLSAACPADPSGAPAPYHYTLGYRSGSGSVVGPRWGDPDGTPLTADPPVGRSPHRNGQNVLYAGGRVLFATAPTAGLLGDDIYHNVAGVVRAGLHQTDAVLGGPTDCP